MCVPIDWTESKFPVHQRGEDTVRQHQVRYDLVRDVVNKLCRKRPCTKDGRQTLSLCREFIGCRNP